MKINLLKNMTEDLQKIEKDKKAIFKKADYVSFMLGVFIIGGLLIVPLFLFFQTNIEYTDVIGAYFGFVILSLMLCLGVFVAFERNGNTSWIRIIFAIVIWVIVSSAVAAASGKVAAGSDTILGFFILILCGCIGVRINKFIRQYK